MLLKIGSSGEDVKKLQQKLGIGADGSFGPGTEKAVKGWQSANGLTADGIVGDATWTKMFSSPDQGQSVSENVFDTSVFKLDKLKGHIPDSIYSELPMIVEKFRCNNIFRLAHFMGQCSHESNGFKALKENLNYSAEGLRKIFPKYFPTDSIAKQYERNPQKIANKVYSSRMGNGDEASGDGWKFSGAGAIQLTGRSNYKEFSNFVGESEIMTNPELVATKYPLSSAGFFFNKNNLWSICDKGVDVPTITAVTKRVNGGTIGIDHRIKETEKFYKLLNS